MLPFNCKGKVLALLHIYKLIYGKAVLSVQNICPVKSDWLSQWIICACTEVILKGMSLFMEISMCLWKFGVLSQNFMKTTQSILKLWQQVFQGDGCTSPLKPVRWIEVAIFFFDHFRHIFFMIFIKFSLSVIET